MLLQRYPFDPTGRSTDNLVRDELHTLSLDGNQTIVPRYGAFYNASLVVKQGEKTLILNKDYQLSYFWQDATFKVGQPVSIAFQMINNDLLGDILVSYQTVGGEYQNSLDITEQFVHQGAKNHRNTFWDEIIDKPEAYVPTRHLHHINDVFGLSRLVEIIEEMRRSLEHQSVLKLKTVYDRFLKLKQYVEGITTDLDEERIKLRKISDGLDQRLRDVLTRSDAEAIINEKAEELRQVLQEEQRLARNALTDKLEKYNKRIDTVEVKTTQMGNRVDDMGTRVDNTLVMFQRLENTVNTLNNEIDNEVKPRIDEVDQRRAELDTKVERYRQEQANQVNGIRTELVGQIESKAIEIQNAVDNKLTQVNDRLTTKIDTAISTVNSQHEADITRITNEQREQDKKIKENKDLIDKVKEDDLKNLATINNQLANLNTKTESTAQALAEQITKERNDIAEVNGKITGLSNDLNTLKTKTLPDKLKEVNDALTAKHDALRLTVESNKESTDTELGNIKTDLAEKYKAINQKLEEQASQSFSQLDNVLARVDHVLDEQKTALEQSLDEVSQKADNAKSAVDKLQTTFNQHVDSNTEKLNAIKEDIARNYSTVGALNDRQSDFEANQNNLQERLQQLAIDTNTRIDGLNENDKRLTEKDRELERILNEKGWAVEQLEHQLTETNQNVTRLQEDVINAEQNRRNADDHLRQELSQLITTKSDALENQIDTKLEPITQKLDEQKQLLENVNLSSLNEVADLSSGLDKLKELVSEQYNALGNRINDTDRKLDDFKHNIDDLSNDVTSTVAGIQKDIHDSNNNLANLQATVMTNGGGINDLRNKVTVLTQNQNDQKTDLSDVEKRVRALEDKSITGSVVDGKVTAVSANVEAIAKETTNIKQSLADLLPRITAVEEKNNEQDITLNHQHDDIEELKTKYITLNTRLNEADSTGIDDKIARVKSELNSGIDVIRGRTDNLATQFSQLGNNVNTRFTTVEKNVNTLKTDLRTINDKLNDHENRLINIDVSVSTATTNIDNLSGVTDELQRRLTAATDDIHKNRLKISDLTTKANEVDELLTVYDKRITTNMNSLSKMKDYSTIKDLATKSISFKQSGEDYTIFPNSLINGKDRPSVVLSYSGNREDYNINLYVGERNEDNQVLTKGQFTESIKEALNSDALNEWKESLKAGDASDPNILKLKRKNENFLYINGEGGYREFTLSNSLENVDTMELLIPSKVTFNGIVQPYGYTKFYLNSGKPKSKVIIENDIDKLKEEINTKIASSTGNFVNLNSEQFIYGTKVFRDNIRIDELRLRYASRNAINDGVGLGKSIIIDDMNESDDQSKDDKRVYIQLRQDNKPRIYLGDDQNSGNCVVVRSELDDAINEAKNDIARTSGTGGNANEASIINRVGNEFVSLTGSQTISGTKLVSGDYLTKYKDSNKYFRLYGNADNIYLEQRPGATSEGTAIVSINNNGIYIGSSTKIASQKLLTKAEVNGLASEKVNTMKNTILEEARNEFVNGVKLEAFKNDLAEQNKSLSNKLDEAQSRLEDKIRQHYSLSLQEVVRVNREVDDLKAELRTNSISGGNSGGTIDPATLTSIVNSELNKRIAQARENETEAGRPFDLSHFTIPPSADGSVTENPDGSMTIRGIVYMDSSIIHNEYDRNIFTPTTKIEFTKDTTWVIPDIYDGLVAQVYLTTSSRQIDRYKMMSSSVKVGYVTLKGGHSVQVSIGAITSLGTYITNDGVSQDGLITPSQTYVYSISGTDTFVPTPGKIVLFL